MRTVALIVSLLLFSLASFAQDKTGAGQSLKEAKDAYAAAIAKAQADYDTAAKKAAEGYVAALKVLQDEKTKAGDLDGALAVREEVASFEKTEPPSPAKNKDLIARQRFSASLSKVVWVPGPGGWGQEFVFAEDGYVCSPLGKRNGTTWATVAPGTVLTISAKGVVDCFSIDLAEGTAHDRVIGTAQRPSTEWNATRKK